MNTLLENHRRGSHAPDLASREYAENYHGIIIGNFPLEIQNYFYSYIHKLSLTEQEDLTEAFIFRVDRALMRAGVLCITTKKEKDYEFFIDTDGYGLRYQGSNIDMYRKFTWNIPYKTLDIYVCIYWVKFFTNNDVLSITTDNKFVAVEYQNNGNKNIFVKIKDVVMVSNMTIKNRIQFFLINNIYAKSKFKNCWLFIDRDIGADDNAEHLYRFVMKNHPEKNIFFALRKDSPDWARLKNDGFNLIDNRSIQYIFAWFQAQWIISSNMTGYITKPGWKKTYGNKVTHRFCFLQHGVTKDYQPTLNRRGVDMLITASPGEFHAFAHNKAYPYIFSKRETRLTGLPRHDALIHKATAVERPSTILFMPTWRRDLIGKMQPGGSSFLYSSTFKKSHFFSAWQALFQSQTVREHATRAGYTLKICLHPYLRQQAVDFTFPDFEIVGQETSIQDVLADTSLLVTDYSSVAIDAALIHRTILYYQFDQDEFFNTHSYYNGYFDYERDGFGEVIEDKTMLEEHIVSSIKNNCIINEIYKARADAFFAFHDTGSCERVYNAINDICRAI